MTRAVNSKSRLDYSETVISQCISDFLLPPQPLADSDRDARGPRMSVSHKNMH